MVKIALLTSTLAIIMVLDERYSIEKKAEPHGPAFLMYWG